MSEWITMADDHPGLRLELCKSPEGLEPVFDYEPGGFHPVHLDDQFRGQHAWRVVHKLGHGGCATVWLCWVLGENPRYVALKILMADHSGDDCPDLQGVNRLRDAGLMKGKMVMGSSTSRLICSELRAQMDPTCTSFTLLQDLGFLVSPRFLTTGIGCCGKSHCRLRVLWPYSINMEFAIVVSATLPISTLFRNPHGWLCPIK